MTTRWITIAGRKGGVGKSSCALALAAHYRRAGKSVLIVDLDPQGSASIAFGSTEPTGKQLRAVLQGEERPCPTPFWNEQFISSSESEISYDDCLNILEGGPALAACENVLPLRSVLADPPHDVRWRVGGNNPSVPGRELRADVVIVDCPPGHAELDRLAIQAADILLACCECHRMAVAGASRIIEEAKVIDPAPRCALVLGRVDVRRGLDLAAPELLAGALNVPVMSIRQDSVLSQALNAGQLPPGHGRAAEDIAKIAAWIG